jgi:hypothetical protein
MRRPATGVTGARLIDSTYAWDTDINAENPLADSQVYTPDLVDLIRSDAELASTGGAVKLDFDPLCSCQDPTAVKSKRVSVKKTSPSSATAQVRLLYADGTGRSLSLDLQWLPDGWRIRDVHASTIPSLRRFLQRPAETSNSAPRSSSSTLRP